MAGVWHQVFLLVHVTRMMTLVVQIIQRASGSANQLATLLWLSCLRGGCGLSDTDLSAAIAILFIFLVQKELLVLSIFFQLFGQGLHLELLLFQQSVFGLYQLRTVLELQIFVLEYSVFGLQFLFHHQSLQRQLVLIVQRKLESSDVLL